MIVEQAVFPVVPGAEEDFTVAVEQAKHVIAEAGGFRSLKLLRGIDQPSTFVLLVEWDTVEDHMVGFRESELYGRWRELIGPYLAGATELQHFQAPSVTR